ncbi:MAG: hypothetical protein A2270_03290 [Elusimicrobia bacterium RIFOXYA12_FULL_51_18]|nr:MAG: hypothetical protein A2270_03290 [Elusimicrobia bacterium RIFOXYA12_FULL_51_18]OGS31872.1 MAG: hypothetical protein A2218_06255 [Elusimicrobia bacterium RIFOXYA2_FULL_53_38]
MSVKNKGEIIMTKTRINLFRKFLLAAVLAFIPIRAMGVWPGSAVNYLPGAAGQGPVDSFYSIQDETGGIYNVWTATAPAHPNYHQVYVQHINMNGVPDWFTRVSTSANYQDLYVDPKLSYDGQTALNVAWGEHVDSTAGSAKVMKVKRFISSGSIVWGGVGGIQVSSGIIDGGTMEISSDGGPVFMMGYPVGSGLKMVVQKLQNSGGGCAWPGIGDCVTGASGTELYSAANTDSIGNVALVPSSSGMLIVVSTGVVSGDWAIYAHRLNETNGSPVWSSTLVSGTGARGGIVNGISDGSNGAYIVWDDARSGYKNVYATRIDNDGAVVTGGAWSLGANAGVQFTNFTDDINNMHVVPTADGFALTCSTVTGQDQRFLFGTMSASGVILSSGVTAGLEPLYSQAVCRDSACFVAGYKGVPEFTAYVARITPGNSVSLYPMFAGGDFPYNIALSSVAGGIAASWTSSAGAQWARYAPATVFDRRQVSGLVTFSGVYEPNTVLTVWLSTSADFRGVTASTHIPNPSTTQSYTISDIPSGIYYMALTASFDWQVVASTHPWGVLGQLGTPTAVDVTIGDVSGNNVAMTDGHVQPNPWSPESQAPSIVSCVENFANGGSCRINGNSTYGNAIAVDGSDNSYIIGTNLTDSAIVKYDASGVIVSSITAKYAVFNDIKISPVNGDLYVAAQGLVSGIRVFRYAASNLSFVSSITVSGYQGARQLDFGADGEVYVVSAVDNGGSYGNDIRVVRLSANLSSVTGDWSDTSNGPDQGIGIHVSGGDVFVTGFQHPVSTDQVVVIRLSTATTMSKLDTGTAGTSPVVFAEGEGFNHFRVTSDATGVYAAYSYLLNTSTQTAIYRFDRSNMSAGYSSATMAGAAAFGDLKSSGSKFFVVAQSDGNQARVTRYDAATFAAEASTRASVPAAYGMAPGGMAFGTGGEVYLSGALPDAGDSASIGITKLDSVAGPVPGEEELITVYVSTADASPAAFTTGVEAAALRMDIYTVSSSTSISNVRVSVNPNGPYTRAAYVGFYVDSNRNDIWEPGTDALISSAAVTSAFVDLPVAAGIINNDPYGSFITLTPSASALGSSINLGIDSTASFTVGGVMAEQAVYPIRSDARLVQPPVSFSGGGLNGPSASILNGTAMDQGVDVKAYGSSVYAIGIAYPNSVLIKYSTSTGQVAALTGLSGVDFTALAVNANGIYVTGKGYYAPGFVTIKYAHDLTIVSSVTLAGASSAYGITLDGAGRVYVIGDNAGEGGSNNDYKIVEYNSDLVQQGAAHIWNAGGVDYGKGIAVSDDGSLIYATGLSLMGGATYYATAKFDGAFVFVSSTAYPGYADDHIDTVDIVQNSTSGAVYLAGSANHEAMLLAKYNSNLVLQSTAGVYSPAYAVGAGIAQDSVGNVYIAGGYNAGGAAHDENTVVKFSPALVRQSSATTFSAYGFEPGGLALDGYGYPYVTGVLLVSGSSSTWDMKTVRLAQLADVVAAKPYITVTVPYGGAVDVSSGIRYIDITFSEPVTPASLNAGGDGLSPYLMFSKPGGYHNPRFTGFSNLYGNTYRIAMVDVDLDSNTVYTVEAANFESGSAVVMDPASFSFTTTGSAPAGKPSITATNPTAGATGVSLGLTAIDITFSEPIVLDAGDIGGKINLFVGAEDRYNLLSTFTYVSGNTYRLELKNGPLAAGTVYRVELSNFANESAAVIDPDSFSFTTEAGATTVNLLVQNAASPYMRYYSTNSALKLSLWTDSGSSQWSAMTVNLGGTVVPCSDVDALYVYRDSGDGAYSDTNDSYVGYASPCNGGTFNFYTPETIGVSTSVYFVTVSPRSSAIGKTARLTITSTAAFTIGGSDVMHSLTGMPANSAIATVMNYIYASEMGSYNYDTNISVIAGQALQINATGYWNYDATHQVNADGSGECSSTCPLPSAYRGALIARGDSTPWFVVGRSTTIVLGYSDTLRLAMNDDDYNDNTGIMMFEKAAQAVTKIWTGAACGGVGCNEAGNPMNWQGGVLPAYGDNVVFGGTGAKDCLWNLNITVNSLYVYPEYNGRISLINPPGMNINRLEITDYLYIRGGTFDIAGNILAASSITVSGGVLDLGAGLGDLQVGPGGLNVTGTGTLAFTGNTSASIDPMAEGYYPISIFGGTVTVNGAGLLNIRGSNGIAISNSPALTFNNVRIMNLASGATALSITAASGDYTFDNWGFDASVTNNVGLTGSAMIYMNNASGAQMGTPHELSDPDNRIIWNPDGGGTGSIGGNLSYSGNKTGNYIVFVTTNMTSSSFAAISTSASTGYSFGSLKAPATYYLWATRDSNSDYDYTASIMEPIGWLNAPVYLSTGAALTRNMTLLDTGKITGTIDKSATNQAGMTIVELHTQPLSATSLFDWQVLDQWEYQYLVAAPSATYTVLAYIDVNQNERFDPAFESSGTATDVLISTGGTVTNNIALNSGSVEAGGIVGISTTAFFAGSFIGKTNSAAVMKLGLVSNGGEATVGSLRFSSIGTAEAGKFSLSVYKDDGNGLFDNDPSIPNSTYNDMLLGNGYFGGVSSQAAISFTNEVGLLSSGATQYFFVMLTATNPVSGSTIGAVLLSSDSVGLLKGTMAGQAIYPVSTPLRTVSDSIDVWSTLYTGVDVYSGQTINISASGQWQVNGVYVYATGSGSNMYNGVYPNAPVGALIAQVGYNSPWFYVGTSTSFVYSGMTGPLMLHMNTNYDFGTMMWNYPNGVSGQLYVNYSVEGDTHAVISGLVTYAGGTNGTIIVNAGSRRPDLSRYECRVMTPSESCMVDVIVGTHTIPSPLAGGTSYYTMGGIEIPQGDSDNVIISAYIQEDPSQRGIAPTQVGIRIGQAATGGDVTVYSGAGTLNGNISYSGAQQFGNTVVALFTNLEGGNPVVSTTLAEGVSAFSIADIPGPALYYVVAFRDLDYDNKPSGPEPFGYYGSTGPISLMSSNAVQLNVASNVVTNVPATINLLDMGQINGRIDLGSLQFGIRVLVQAGHGIPGSSFVKENQSEYFAQPCWWYGCINEVYYNVGTLSPAEDYTVVAFLDKNGNNQWDCDAENCERFASSRNNISVTANGMAQADIALTAAPVPDTPQSFSGTVLSTDVILWAWNDVPTETSYYLTTSTGGILHVLDANTTQYSETVAGGANTISSVRAVRAHNYAGDSPLSSMIALYTKAAAPELVVNGVSASEVNLGVSSATNRFVLQRSTAIAGGYIVVYSTYTGTSVTSRVDAGLTPGTTYYYRALNFNAQSVASAYSAVAIATTTAPTGYFIRGTVNYPGLMTGNITLLASTQEFLSNPITVALSGNTTQAYYLTGLASNTSYYIRAFVDYNADNARQIYEDASAIAGPIYLAASGLSGQDINIVRSTAIPASPSGLVATPGFQRVSLQWIASAASNLIGYEVFRSTNASFSSAVTRVSGDSFVTGASFTDFNPLAGVPLYYRVKAADWGRNRSLPAALSSPVNVSAGGSITGTVYAVDTSTQGLYHVRVSTTPDANVPSLMDIMVSTAPATYTVSGLPDGSYYVRGYRDFNNDFKQDRRQEPSGTHGGIARPFDIYMTQGNSLTGIDVKVCNRLPLAVGVSTRVTISATGCEALDRGPGYYTRVYTLEAGYGAGKVPTGSQITVYANKTDPLDGINDAYLYLVGPTGDVVARDDDSGGDMNSRIQYTLDTPGVYLIEPTSYASGLSGALNVGFDVTGGFAGRISGTLSYSGSMTGPSVVQIYETLTANSWPVMMSSTSVSDFEIIGLRDGNFYLKAFKDVNGNGVQDSFEPYGVYGGTTAVQFSVSGGVTSASLAITLAEPAVGSVSGNLFYNGGRTGNIRIEAARQRGSDQYDLEVVKFSTVTRGNETVDQAYILDLLAPATDYTIRAFVDENSNNQKDVMEPFISARSITVTASTQTTGVNLNIVNPGSGGVGNSILSGAITYTPIPGQNYISTGNIWVGWASDQSFENILYSQVVSTFTQYASSTAWTYSKSDVMGGATYYMASFLDLNGNGQPDDRNGEPMAMYSIDGEMAPVSVPTSSTVVRNLALTPPSTGYLSGVVHYYGAMTGSAKVSAWNQSCENTSEQKDCSAENYFAIINGVTDYPFTLRFLNPTTSYQLSSVIDLNGNQMTDPGEPNAYLPGYIVSGSTTAALTIMDPGQMAGGNIGEIRGIVTYGGHQGGDKIVRLFRGGFYGAPVQTMNINAGCLGNSCSFAISGLSYAADYYVDAFVDSSFNGMFEPAFEPHGGITSAISVSQAVPQSRNNYMTLEDPGTGADIPTGSNLLSGMVSVQGGTPSGTVRVQLFRFVSTVSVMEVPIRVATYPYVSSANQTPISYSFDNLPSDGGARYIAQAYVDSNSNFTPDRNEAWGQTKALNQGISTSDPAEQKNFSVCARTSIDQGQNLNGSLETSDCVSSDRGQASAFVDYYSFGGRAGDIVTLEMTGTGFSDTYLYLYGPSMRSTEAFTSYNLAAFDDDGGGNYNSKINGYTLTADGIYTIGAASYGNNITGAYTLSMRVSGGTNGSIAGTVRYNGTQGGNINVGLFNSNPMEAQNVNSIMGASMQVPGAFLFGDLPSGTSYYIAGFVDVNGNNSPDQGEDFGMYPNIITLRAGQNVTGTLLEINHSTDVVFVGGAGQGTISGAISYTGISTATSLVIEMWNTATFRGTPIGIRTMQLTGEWPVNYDLQVPGDQTYYLKAFLDANNNRMPEPSEAKGAYTPNNEGPEPIYVGSAAYITDRNFTLYDPGQTLAGGAQGVSGEGWASVLPSLVAAGSQFTSTVTVRVTGLGEGGVVMVGMPNNLYSSLQTGCSGCPGYVQVSSDGTHYSAAQLISNNAQYRVPMGQSLAAGASVYFAINNLYAPCQGGMTGQQSDNRLVFHVGTSSNAFTGPQPLVSGEPTAVLGAGAPQNLSFRLADNMNGANMAVPNGEVTPMLAEARDNCWNLAPMSSVYIATVSAYFYNMATYGYDNDATVKFSTWNAEADSVTATSATVRFEADSSTGVFYVKPTAQGYRNIGLSYDLAWSNTFYMGVQVMAGGGISGANVSTGAYNNLSASSMTVTITPNGDGNADRAYVNFIMGDANMGWHVLVSSRPFRTGVSPTPVWETWGWGQPNPGQIFWEGRYNPWMNFGGVVPTGAYFVRIEAGSLRNDTLRINVVVPQVSGQVTDAGTSPQRPLEGVMVNTFGAFGWGQATTDSNGNFSIPGLAAGQYNFQFSKEEYGMVSSQTVVGVNGATVNASMRRAPALVIIPSLGNGTTQQYDQWGWINVHTSDWSRVYNGSLRVQAGTTTIDDGGRWDASTNQFVTRRRIRFDVEAATYTVEAELTGYGRVSSTVYVGSSGLELTLPSFVRKANLSGLVRLPVGAPNTTGVWISVNALPVVLSSSIAGGWGGIWLNQGVTSGTYNIFGVDSGSYTIRAQVPGYSGKSIGPVFVSTSDINTGLDIPAFDAGSVIRGTVTVVGDTHLFQKPDWANNWEQPVKVSVNVWSPQTYTNGWTEIYVATSAGQAQSTFTITGLDAGTTYQLFANIEYNRDDGNTEFTVPGGFPKQVYVDTTSLSGNSEFSFALASGAIFGTIILPTTPAVDFSSVSMSIRITQSDNPYSVGQSFSILDITAPCGGQNSNCLPGVTLYASSATFSVSGMETQSIEVTFTYRLTGMSRTALVNVISGSTATVVVDLRNQTYAIAGSITNQVSNPLFNTMALAIAYSSYTTPSGYPSIPANSMPIEAVRRDLSEFGAAMTSAVFDPAKTRVGFITLAGTYTIRGLQEGVYVIRTQPLKTCATCEMLVAAQEKIVTIRGLDYTNNSRVIVDGLSVSTGAVNFTLIDGWNVSGLISIDNNVQDARTLALTLRNRRNEVVRSTTAALGNSGTNSLANSVAYSFTRLPGGEFYTLEVRDTKDSTGTIKYAAAPLRFPDIASSPNGMQSDLSSQNVTLKQGAMVTLKLRDVNSASLLTQTNYTLLAANFSCFAMANPWVQGGYYLAASSISNRPIEADGTVRIGPVMPNVYYDVKCEQSNWDVGYMRQGAQNYSPAVVAGIRPSAGETRDLGVLDLRQGQAMSGIVSSRDGFPLVNIKVTAKPSYIENPITIQAMTNRDGRYTLWVSTYMSRYFDITAAPREQNQTVDVSTIIYRESVYTAIDLTRSTTVDFTLDAMLGGVEGSVVTIDSGVLSYPFGDMQGYPAAALFIQPYGTVPKNNPIGDIEAITEPGGGFSVPLTTGSYTMRIVSLGYSVPVTTFAVTGSGMVNLGATVLPKGGTVTGQIRKPDSTAVGGYTEPNSDEISLVTAANDGFTEFVMGTVVSDPVSRTITRYAISGFKPNIDYSLALMSDNNDMTFPSEGSVRFSQDESTATKSVNLTFRPSHGDCMVVSKRGGSGMRLKFVCSKAFRNRTAEDNNLTLILATSSVDSSGHAVSAPDGSGALSDIELSADRKQFTALYSTAASEGMFSIRLAAYTSEIDQATGDNFMIDRVYDFYTGVKSVAASKLNNMRGGRVELEGEEGDDERGAVEFPPGTFALDGSAYALVATTVTVEMLKADDLDGATAGTSALAAGKSGGGRLASVQRTLPKGLYNAMQALREQRVGNYKTRAVSGSGSTVNPFSSFYDISLPAGISHVLQQPARITLSYNTALSSGTDASDLNVYYYNPNSQRYVLESRERTLDRDNGTISVNVDHLSVFVVLAQAPADGATAYAYTGKELKAHNFPNPFNNTRTKSISLNDAIATGGYTAAAAPCTTQGTCIRVFVPAGTSGDMTLKVFNIAGELVREMQLTGYSAGTTNVWPWDGKNGSGAGVASGVYIGEVKVGGDKAFFKMAVIKASKYQ